MAGPKKPGPLTPEERKTAERMSSKRRRFEKTPTGSARMKQAHELLPGHEKLGVGGTYAHQSWGFQVGHGETPMGQGILPGMEAPGRAAAPTRWEDLHPHEQERTLRHLSKWGTNLHHMERSFGAQLDQGFVRAHHEQEGSGQFPIKPMYHDFYSPESEHGQKVHELAAKHGIHPSVASAIVAHTSPQTKWHQSGRFPNIEAADHVITHVLSGKDPNTAAEEAFVRHPHTGEIETVKTGRDKGKPKKHQGFGTNMVKAAHQLKAHIEEGAGFTMGPKTGPFHNSFNDYTHDFLVADVHTGGGGMLPHLSSAKALRRTKDGKLARTKQFKADPRSDDELVKAVGHDAFDRADSEREAVIKSVPNFHAAADYAARQALQKRGLSSVRRSQAVQWGEEQHHRAAADPRMSSVIAHGSRAQEFIAGHGQAHPDHPTLF